MTEIGYIAALAAVVVAFVIGHYLGKNPAKEAAVSADAQSAVAWVKNEWAKEKAALTAHKDVASVAPAPGPVAVAAAAGISPAATPAWTLGTSYPSLPALLADASPRTDRMIRVNDAPVTGFTLPNPADFYTWPDGSVAQTKPA